jgi:hypothetical protein
LQQAVGVVRQARIVDAQYGRSVLVRDAVKPAAV